MMMNREQRRAARKAARHKPAREVYVPAPMLIKTQIVFAPLESVLDEIERTGTVDVAGGAPVFQPPGESAWYALAPAIVGVANLFDMWAARHGKTLDVSALTRLAKKLEYAMPIAQSDIDDTRATMNVLRRVPMGHQEAVSLVQQTQIKAELEARKL